MLAQAWKVRFLLDYALVRAIIGELTTKSMREMADVVIGHWAYSCFGKAIKKATKN